MQYVDKLQAGLQKMVEAGEAGRTSIMGMLSPVGSALSSMTAAADALESLPFVDQLMGSRLQRIMRGVENARAKVNQVISTASDATEGAARVRDNVGQLNDQVARSKSAVGQLAPDTTPSAKAVVSTAALAPNPVSVSPEAVSGKAHLLIMQPLDARHAAFHFGIETAAFDAFKRKTSYRWASQERLGRSPAQQAVGQGEDTLSLSGTIYPGFKGGLGQLKKLRSVGSLLQPVLLTTGYGESMGTWCLMDVGEDQDALLDGGIFMKQGFTLEFKAYGDDLQNR